MGSEWPIIKVEVSVFEAEVAEALYYALNGGSKWAQLMGKDRPYEAKPNRGFNLKANFQCFIADKREDDGRRWILNRESLVSGLAILARMEGLGQFSLRKRLPQAGDALLQCAMFGELIYGYE